MQLTLVFFFLLTSILATTATTNTNPDVYIFTRVVSDIASHATEYVNFFQTNGGSVEIPTNFVGALPRISTFTDDSYTTLAENSVLMAEIHSLVTQLPWYDERIAEDGDPVASLNVSSAATGTATTTTAATATTSTSTSAANGGGKVAPGVMLGGFAGLAGLAGLWSALAL
ncbi:uncharacterized protein LODBEIA_P19500 [Lodderomyces beijingensis]|uniref:FAS1 domain-containing protein n=1 Tax=Lodderomyces beijingensis TaxID=1775926 RepID=A0ABP0ZLF9_9ASCO